MGNTLTSLSATIIAQQVLEAYKAGLTVMNAFSIKHEVRPGAGAINVPVITARTASTAPSSYESGDSTIVGVPITPSEHAYCSWHVTDEEALSLDTNAMAAAAIECAYAVALKVYQGTIGLFTAATFGDVAGTSKKVVTGANFDADEVAALVGMMEKRNTLGNKSLIASIDYVTGLRTDAALQDASALGSDEIIRSGFFSLPLLGVNVYKTNAFPAALTNEFTGAIMCVPSAIALATRPVAPLDPALASSAGLSWEVVTDPDTGLSVGTRMWYNTATFTTWGTVAVQWGADSVQDAGAVRATSQ